MFLPFAIAHILASPHRNVTHAATKPKIVHAQRLALSAEQDGSGDGPLNQKPRAQHTAPGHPYVKGKPNALNTWAPISPFGISVDPVHNIWHSGHVSGIVAGSPGYLVSTDTGGVYLVTPTNTAVCVSEAWDKPNTHSMCLGMHGPKQVFVGGDGLYMTDWKSILPYFSWFPVDMSSAGDYGYISQIAVDQALGAIVIATRKEGILWAFIEDDPTKFVWHQAVGTPTNCWSVAIGPAGSIIAGTYRTDALDPNWPIYYGSFSFYDGYEMTVASLPASVMQQKSMFCTSVCADPIKSNNTYAVASDMKASGRGKLGFVSKILRSTNGGQSWSECGYNMPGDPGGSGDIRVQSGDQGYGYNNCIAAGGGGQVLIGWSSAAFYSNDNGFDWRALDSSWFFNGTTWNIGQDDWNVHPDYHSVGFRFPGSIYMLLGHDGGFTQVHGSFDTTASTQLTTMQFYGNDLGVSPAVDGLCAGGNQDNGIPYTIAGASMPYQETELGFDGNECRFIKPGAMIFNHDGNSSYALWTGTSLNFTAFIPLTVPKPGQNSSRTIPASYFEPVPQPSFTRSTFNVYGVMAEGLDIYELMGDKFGTSLQYWYLGTLPGSATTGVTAMGMMNLGSAGIFIATSDGNLYEMDASSSYWLQLNVVPPTDGQGNALSGEIDRIALDMNSNQGYAVFNSSGGQGYVLKSDSYLLNWSNYGTNVPTQDGIFYGLAVGESNRNGNPATVYLASDANVYQSPDAATTWALETSGLPTRIHVGQLVFQTQSDGTHWLYAPSYGSAVWRMQVP